MTGEKGEFFKPDPRQETIEVYNRTADEMAAYFDNLGPRINDIDLAFRLAGNPKNAKVVEIGCGDGRDGQVIAERTNSYIGFDPSIGMLRIAREKSPDTDFVQADALNFRYPENLDIVFAFASLLHINKEEMEQVIDRVHQALRPGGIFFISLKFAKEYQEYVKSDKFGERMFYLYRPKIIKELAGDAFETVYQERSEKQGTRWFEMALRKKA
jgi:SAM-dependent methyltransferase